VLANQNRSYFYFYWYINKTTKHLGMLKENHHKEAATYMYIHCSYS